MKKLRKQTKDTKKAIMKTLEIMGLVFALFFLIQDIIEILIK